jgi:hypothetical protein
MNFWKVYIIIVAFFGNEGNVSFTKRSLRSLCGKLSKEQADDDVMKTTDAFESSQAYEKLVSMFKADVPVMTP